MPQIPAQNQEFQFLWKQTDKDAVTTMRASEIAGVGCITEVTRRYIWKRGPTIFSTTFVPGVHIVQGELRPFGEGP